MNKDEILAKSRSENNSEYEQNTYKVAGSLARIIGGLVCAGLLVAEQFITGHFNCGYWLIFCVMQVVHDGYIFARTRTWQHLFSAVVFVLVAAVMAYGYVTDLISR